jgi:hypothetical protein
MRKLVWGGPAIRKREKNQVYLARRGWPPVSLGGGKADPTPSLPLPASSHSSSRPGGEPSFPARSNLPKTSIQPPRPPCPALPRLHTRAHNHPRLGGGHGHAVLHHRSLQLKSESWERQVKRKSEGEEGRSKPHAAARPRPVTPVASNHRASSSSLRPASWRASVVANTVLCTQD